MKEPELPREDIEMTSVGVIATVRVQGQIGWREILL
jgi:hypothetical protein